MAEYLSSKSSFLKIRNALCGVMLLVTGLAFSEDMPDPTKPPVSMSTGREQDIPSATASGSALQSIIISPSHRIAIIAGQTVRQGDKYGDARVIKITETEVVLKNGNDTQTLKLYPNIEKQPLPRQVDTKKTESRGDKGKS